MLSFNSIKGYVFWLNPSNIISVKRGDKITEIYCTSGLMYMVPDDAEDVVARIEACKK